MSFNHAGSPVKAAPAPAKRSGGRPGRLKLLLGASVKKLKKDHKPETDEANLPSSPRPHVSAKQRPATVASPSDARPQGATALPPTPQLPRKQAKFAGSTTANETLDKPAPQSTPAAAQSPAVAAAAPSATETGPVELRHQDEVSEMLTASGGTDGAIVDPMLESPGVTSLPQGPHARDRAPEVVETAQHEPSAATATRKARQEQVEELANTGSLTFSQGAPAPGPALPALPALATLAAPELVRLAAAPLPGTASPSPQPPPRPVAGPQETAGAPSLGPKIGVTSAAAAGTAGGHCGAAGSPAGGSPTAPGRPKRRLRRQGGMKGSGPAAAGTDNQHTASADSDGIMRGPRHLEAKLEVGLLDPDTLALLSDKTRQALEARSAAAAAQQAITQLTLEQGARQAEAQDARRQLAALAALLPSPLPPAVAAFEGGGEEAHARLADLQAQLAVTQGFLRRAAALSQQGGELSRLLGMLHAARAARLDIAAPQDPKLAAAAMQAAVVAGGHDAVGKCEAASEATRELLTAADAAVSGWVLTDLEELQGSLQREELAKALQAEQLEREIDDYKALVMHLPAIQRQRSAEASLRDAERALREIEARLEAERAALKEHSAKYAQLSALCNRIRLG
ncbi:hypothetical protein N2152v2_008874 [Parachlorella kessleri]